MTEKLASRIRPHPLSQPLLFGAMVSIGVALKVNGGNFHPVAFGLLVVGMACGIAAMLRIGPVLQEKPESETARPIETKRAENRLFSGMFLLLVVVQITGLFWPPIVPPSKSIDSTDLRMHLILQTCGFPPPTDYPEPATAVYLLLVAVAVLGFIAFLAVGWTKRWVSTCAMAVALFLYLAALIAAVRAAPAPAMDVLIFQSFSAEHLLEGGNPYQIGSPNPDVPSFPDITGGMAGYYGPGLQADGVLRFGFPYMPLSLLCLLPIRLAGGGLQYAHAIALTSSAGLLAVTGNGRSPKAAGLLLMLIPVGPMVVCYGWTEPLAMAALALTIFLASRLPRVSGLGLGLFWAMKQYIPLTAPLSILLIRRPASRGDYLRLIVFALVCAAVVTLPLVLADVSAFWHSAVLVQFLQPFRPDSLSVPAAVYHATGIVLPSWSAFVAIGLVQGLAIWRAPRTPAGFACATGVSLLVFFAFSKQAFANYYMLALAGLAGAIAVNESTLIGTPDATGTTSATSRDTPRPVRRAAR